MAVMDFWLTCDFNREIEGKQMLMMRYIIFTAALMKLIC